MCERFRINVSRLNH